MTSDRVRNLVILTVMGVWVVVIGFYLADGELPDAPLLGIPGAVYLALHPPRIGRANPEPEAPAADSGEPTP